MNEQETQKYSHWSVLELFGHRRIAGYVSEVTIAGAGWLRIDVPKSDSDGWSSSHLYPPAAAYGLHPVEESIARRLAAQQGNVMPFQQYELEVPQTRPGVPAVAYHKELSDFHEDDECPNCQGTLTLGEHRDELTHEPITVLRCASGCGLCIPQSKQDIESADEEPGF